MTAYMFHRGVGFSIREVAVQRWKWTVRPPKSVRGLEQKTGEVAGAREDAVAAAKREIETQETRIVT